MRAIEWRRKCIVIVDQTALPRSVQHDVISTVDDLVDAITALKIRGAPMLGAAGALGVALAVYQAQAADWGRDRLNAEIDRITRARPTAVNLEWGVKAVLSAIPEGAAAVEAAALATMHDVASVNYDIAQRGADYLTGRQDAPLRLHTHCNTGALACVEWGTALGVIRMLHERGRVANVIVDETRPLLQGARLTTWELAELGIEHRLICDGAGPFVIAQGLVDAVIVGADRIAANGDTANKIGTYGLALAAHYGGIPFVVAAPESTIDWSMPSGESILIEERPESEITQFAGTTTAPRGTRALNFAFDVTPSALITAIITERRVIAGNQRQAAMQQVR